MRNFNQLDDNESTNKHREAVRKCKTLANLGRLLTMEVEKLADDLNISRRNVFIVDQEICDKNDYSCKEYREFLY